MNGGDRHILCSPTAPKPTGSWVDYERRAMFKTEAMKTSSGSYDVQATCPKGHTCFKKRGDSNTYKCPYCGHDVP